MGGEKPGDGGGMFVEHRVFVVGAVDEHDARLSACGVDGVGKPAALLV